MKKDVMDSSGNEVFWSGTIDSKGIVVKVVVGSRGNEHSVVVNGNVAREGQVLIHNHPSGILEPSGADLNVASSSSENALGFYIVDNEISRVYVVVEPIKPKVIIPLDEEKISFLLSKNGILAKQNALFEERPSQIQLVKNIAKTFNDSKIGVFEAGTGVGKSFAYLLPAMEWASTNKERVVISTGTINLQQQLMEKDIPAAVRILGKNVKSILLKGRQNYLCLRRLEDALLEKDLFDEENAVLSDIQVWSKTTATGSISDLSFFPQDSVWSRVNSESDACFGMRCPFREKCFVMKVRKEASDAQILVVNHHLLFADIESRMNGAGYEDVAVLPPYKHIVFDEAHGIEDSATSFFSESITRFKLLKSLNMLYRKKRGSVAGFLLQASVLISTEDFLLRAASEIQNVKECIFSLDSSAENALSDSSTARISEKNASAFADVFSCLVSLKRALGKLTSFVREAFENISDDDKDMPCVWETKSVLRRLEDAAILCGKFSEWNEHEDTVCWLQSVKISAKHKGDSDSQYVQFSLTPLDIAPLMNNGVFEQMNSVVCTSATLKTGRDFSFWIRRVGISFAEKERVLEKEFDSPFLYKEHVLFAVPNDAPFPDNQIFQSYIEETLPKLILASGGKTLVLFTSYDSLRHAYSSARAILQENGITILKQGSDDRFKLLENFKNDRESVLFATDSFWEGVDVPGDSLSQVIIVKLPFAVPNDPVFAARSEAVEKRGGSSFMELSVPQAVIKFRQGFGRLIRRGDDRGIIVVLDRRIVEKSYGKQFTESVPKTFRMYNPLNQIIQEIPRFLNKK